MTTFSYTGSVQTFNVTTTGTYDITTYGAQGGSDGLADFIYPGGLGAEIGGDFDLPAGATIRIVVGGQGGSALLSGGGGGGSFVIEMYNGVRTVLEIAGGGGAPGSRPTALAAKPVVPAKLAEVKAPVPAAQAAVAAVAAVSMVPAVGATAAEMPAKATKRIAAWATVVATWVATAAVAQATTMLSVVEGFGGGR